MLWVRSRRKRRRAATPAVQELWGAVEPTAVSDPRQNSPDMRFAYLISLIARGMQEPLNALRRVEDFPTDLLRQFERLAWQTRMVVAPARPMKAQPASPVTLLQEAVEESDLLSEGKVGASWSLSTREPVQIDPERARSAFRELLTAAARSSGEGGKIAIRVFPCDATGFAVQVEIEIGRPGGEPDPLAFLVARHLLESQGAQVELDSAIVRILLRNAVPEPLEDDRGRVDTSELDALEETRHRHAKCGR